MTLFYELMSLKSWKELVRLYPAGTRPSGVRDSKVVGFTAYQKVAHHSAWGAIV